MALRVVLRVALNMHPEVPHSKSPQSAREAMAGK